MKLQHRLILSHTVTALAIIGIISFITNFSIKNGFERYIINEHNLLVNEITLNLSHLYTDEGYNLNDVEHIGVEAIEKGLIITLEDKEGNILWSAMEHNAGLCEAMISNVKENMFQHYTNWDGNYTEDLVPILKSDTTIGQLRVGYLGPFYFNEEELYFLSTINQVIISVGFGSLILAFIIGSLMSRTVTGPIEDVISKLNTIHLSKQSFVGVPDGYAEELKALYRSAQSLESRIREQEALRKQLTQDMSHELKTPLTSVQGQIEGMLDGIFPLNNEQLQSCYDEIIRIKSLIEEVEKLSFAENNNIEIVYETFNLHKLIESVLIDSEKILAKKNMTWEIIEGPSFNPTSYDSFSGDSDKVKQVFINLTNNALKYAGVESKIAIILDNRGNALSISFKDNGRGIPKEHLPYIFERFYRVDPSRTGHNGLGIGLTLVKSIIEKHHGAITVDSIERKGTNFNIHLPIHAKDSKKETL